MKVTVLGSSSGVAVPHRHGSAYWVESQDNLYLLDCGEGAAGQLVRYEKDYNRILGIAISHTHPDHVSGLFTLLQLMHLTGRKNPLAIYLPSGLVPGFASVFPCVQIYREKWPFPFELKPIVRGTFLDKNGFQLEAIPNHHLDGNPKWDEKSSLEAESFSFYFLEKGNGAAMYTSDVDSLAHLDPAHVKADVLLSEYTHIGLEEILAFANSAKIPQVILTHIPPERESALSQIPHQHGSITVDIAHDGYLIEV